MAPVERQWPSMSSGPITQLLHARSAGAPGAEDELMRLAYAELHRLASRQLQGERQAHSLTPTSLIHEAWLRLAGENADVATDRTAFFGIAARRMRQVLVDHARRRNAEKRGSGATPLSLTSLDATSAMDLDMLALEQALVELESFDPRKARVVELRYFGGLEMTEVAELLSISRATAQRDWEVARSFLFLKLS